MFQRTLNNERNVISNNIINIKDVTISGTFYQSPIT